MTLDSEEQRQILETAVRLMWQKARGPEPSRETLGGLGQIVDVCEAVQDAKVERRADETLGATPLEEMTET